MISSIFSNKKICIFLCVVIFLSAMFSYSAYASIYQSVNKAIDFSNVPVSVKDFVQAKVDEGLDVYMFKNSSNEYLVSYYSSLYATGDYAVAGSMNANRPFTKFDSSGSVIQTGESKFSYSYVSSMYYSNGVENEDDYLDFLLTAYQLDYMNSYQVEFNSMAYQGLPVKFIGVGSGILRVENVGTNETFYQQYDSTGNYSIPMTFGETYNLTFSGSQCYLEFMENAGWNVSDIANTMIIGQGNTIKFTGSDIDSYVDIVTPSTGVIYSIQKIADDELVQRITDLESHGPIPISKDISYYFRIDNIPDGNNTVKLNYKASFEDCLEELPTLPDENDNYVDLYFGSESDMTYSEYRTNSLNNYLKFKSIKDTSYTFNVSSTGDGWGMIFVRDFDEATQTNKDVYVSSFNYDSTMQNNYIVINPNEYYVFYQDTGELSLVVNDVYVQNVDYEIFKGYKTWSEAIADNPTLQEAIPEGTETDPGTDLNSTTVDDNPYISDYDTQNPIGNIDFEMTEAIDSVKVIKDKALSFLATIVDFGYGIPGMGDMYKYILVAGFAVFAIKLIFS